VTQDSLIYLIGTGVCGSLTVAVGVLWRKVEKYQENNQKDLEECRRDRDRLWAKLSGTEPQQSRG
jgi:hypothetical protein